MQTQDIFIVHPETEEQAQALKAFVQALKIKFEISRDKREYNMDMVAKIRQGEIDIQGGKGITMSLEELENLCK